MLRRVTGMLCVVPLVLLLCAAAAGGELEDARAKKQEADKLFRSIKFGSEKPERYGEVTRLLEEALALLDKAQAQNASPEIEKLQEDVTSLLFWSRRFTPLDLAPKSTPKSAETS